LILCKFKLCPFLIIIKVNQVEDYETKHERDVQNPWLIFETPTGRIILRKSPLGEADGEFLGSLSDCKLLKKDFLTKFNVPVNFAKCLVQLLFGELKRNKELDELIKHRNVINYVKSQRISWFGHINRMPETSIGNKIYKWKPFISRLEGRPNSRWEDDVSKDLRKINLYPANVNFWASS
jgi:hypothetical protein